MFHTSQIEISKSALQHNIDFLKDFAGKSAQFSSVVKGNAYGHGIQVYVPLAEECGVEHFSVFSANEALEVHRVVSPNVGIMIMGMVENQQLEWAIENNIEFFVFEIDRLQKAIEVAKRIKKKARIHFELETGMNRTGFTPQELREAVQLLLDHREHLSLEGVCTHYAGAESIANYVRVQQQLRNFQKLKKWLEEQGIRPSRYHTACSAAMMRYPETIMDMVRVGILQYGFWPSRETFIEYISDKEDKVGPFVERLITWKTHVMSTKEVSMGEFIGYGTTYLAQTDRKIAIVPVGYSHGFGRSLSNTGRALVRGERVSVIGLVNMNALALDVTSCESTVEKGDEVVLIGNQGDLDISVSSFGELSDQLNYELLTRLPEDIPRIVVN